MESEDGEPQQDGEGDLPKIGHHLYDDAQFGVVVDFVAGYANLRDSITQRGGDTTTTPSNLKRSGPTRGEAYEGWANEIYGSPFRELGTTEQSYIRRLWEASEIGVEELLRREREQVGPRLVARLSIYLS